MKQIATTLAAALLLTLAGAAGAQEANIRGLIHATTDLGNDGGFKVSFWGIGNTSGPELALLGVHYSGKGWWAELNAGAVSTEKETLEAAGLRLFARHDRFALFTNVRVATRPAGNEASSSSSFSFSVSASASAVSPVASVSFKMRAASETTVSSRSSSRSARNRASSSSAASVLSRPSRLSSFLSGIRG